MPDASPVVVPPYRVGLGYDIHRLLDDSQSPGIMLAGCLVPCAYRVQAHSDGDVVLHALVDALLGATGQGDIGEQFPDTDPAYHGKASTYFVKQVLAMPALQGWQVGNVDINIIAQVPRLAAHKVALREQLGHLLQLSPDRIGLKARTNEGCDAIGRHEAIAAQVVILLQS